MRSSTGAHFIALDHVRALAAFLVFSWHFTHGFAGRPSPFEGAPSIFLFAPFDEGHVGVALFMTLSGYLFARLLDGRDILFGAFLFNRALRLFPLLALVMAVVGVSEARDGALLPYLVRLLKGFLLPTWPNGGWSIAVELHFYLLLPLLLAALRRNHAYALVFLGAALATRLAIWTALGGVQTEAYGTIIGRLDQFVLGILASRIGAVMTGRHAAAAAIAVAFAGGYQLFDAAGGYWKLGGFPSPSPLWIVLPTLEGAAFAALIAWYDRSFAPRATGLSGLAARLGEYSYSIYLLHFFVVFRAAAWIDAHVMSLSNYYVAWAWSLAAFCAMGAPAWLSTRFVERPFLRWRVPYFRARARAAAETVV